MMPMKKVAALAWIEYFFPGPVVIGDAVFLAVLNDKIAHAKVIPKTKMEKVSPFTSKCANAHVFTPRIIGCFILSLITFRGM